MIFHFRFQHTYIWKIFGNSPCMFIRRKKEFLCKSNFTFLVYKFKRILRSVQCSNLLYLHCIRSSAKRQMNIYFLWIICIHFVEDFIDFLLKRHELKYREKTILNVQFNSFLRLNNIILFCLPMQKNVLSFQRKLKEP